MSNRKILRDSIQGITKPALGRICSRAGIKSKSGKIYEELRGIIKAHMENILRDCIIFAQNDGIKKRVKLCHLEAVLHIMGMYLGAGATDSKSKTFSKCKKHASKGKKATKGKKSSKAKKAHRFHPGTVSMRDINYQQKNSDCLAFPRVAFKRVVREIGQDYSDNVKYSKQFIEFFQFVIEDYLVCLMEAAGLLAIHAGRERVFTKDIQLARKIRKEKM